MNASRSPSRAVLVTDARRTSALVIVRALGRRGYRVVVADSARGLAFRSRHAHDAFLYPPPEDEPQAFVETLCHEARQRQIDLIIPVTDATLLPLARARTKVEQTCRLAAAPSAALEAAADKWATVELAERLGVPAPRTRCASTVERAVSQAEELGWPVVLKPCSSRLLHNDGTSERLQVRYAANQNELAERMRRFEGRVNVLLQEYHAGTAEGVELLMHEGKPLAAFQHRRIREVPVSGGASSYRESVALDPVLFDYSVRLLQALDWTGLAMVEFKQTAGGPKLMEINGRVWGSLPLAVRCGMDFPTRLAELYLGGPPAGNSQPCTTYACGVRVSNLELEVVWILSVLLGRRRYPFLPFPGRGEALRAFVGLLNPRHKYDVMSLEDPRPALAEIAQIARKLRSKLTSDV